MLRPSRASLLLVAAAACAGDEPSPSTQGICPFKQHVLLASLPDDWDEAPHAFTFGSVGHLVYHGLLVVDETVPLTLVDPCTAAEAPYAAEHGISIPFGFEVIDTPRGRLLYGVAKTGEAYVLDRIDTPGFDAPRQLDVPAVTGVAPVPWGALLCASAADDPDAGDACWLHHGDAGTPARAVGDDIRRYLVAGDRLLVLDMDGALRRVDGLTGDSTPLRSGVSRTWLSEPLRHLVYETAEEQTATVRRLDLTNGDDILLHDGLEPGVGRWQFNGDGTAVGYAPEDALERVFRLDSGSELPVVPHIEVSGNGHGPSFEVRLDDPELLVRAYWNPFSADPPQVWFEDFAFTGTSLRPQREGDIVFYSINDVCYPTRTIWQVDLATGERDSVASSVSGPFIPLESGRYLAGIGDGWGGWEDIVLIDTVEPGWTTLATHVTDWRYHPEQGLVYLRTAKNRGERGIFGGPLAPPPEPD